MNPYISSSTPIFGNHLNTVQALFRLSSQSIPPADEEAISAIDIALQSLPEEIFSWDEETRLKVAKVAAGLFKFRNIDCSYYLPRKALSFTLPKNMKIIVDSHNNSILFLEKKGENSRFGISKVGREIHRVMVEAKVVEHLFSLSPVGNTQKDRRNNYAQFSAERHIERAIQQRVTSGFPRRLFDYEYFLKNHDGFKKRLSVCEKYDDDLLHIYNQTSLGHFPLRLFGLMLSIVECVKGFHDCNFALRDIKPENFVVSSHGTQAEGDYFDRSWKVAFCDFGYVLDANRKDAPRITLCGSLPYCAPELLHYGLKAKSEKSTIPMPALLALPDEGFDLASSDLRPVDMYALGVLFYTLVYKGNFPWEEPKDIYDQFVKQLHVDTERRLVVETFDPAQNNIAACLDPIIFSMLTPSISQRATIDQVLDSMRVLELQVNLCDEE